MFLKRFYLPKSQKVVKPLHTSFPLGCSYPPKLMDGKLMFLSKCFHNHKANSWFCQDESVNLASGKGFRHHYPHHLAQIQRRPNYRDGSGNVDLGTSDAVWSIKLTTPPDQLPTSVLFLCQGYLVSLTYNTVCFLCGAFQILWLKST